MTLSQNNLLMQRVFLCLFLLISSCTYKGDFLDQKSKNGFLERLKTLDAKSKSSDLSRLSDSILQLPKLKDSTFITKVSYYKAKSLLAQQNIDAAVTVFKAVKPYFKAHNINDFNIKSGLYLAMCYANLGAYIQANITGIEAKNEALKFGDLNLISATLESLSYQAYKNKDHTKALDYMHEAEAYCRKQNNETKLSVTLNNLGILYRNLGNPKKAQFFQEEALALNLKNEDALGISKSYSNIGLLAEEQGKTLVAIEHYLKAIQINEEHHLVNPNPLINLADIYVKLKDFDKAKDLFKKAIVILEQKSDWKKLRELNIVLLNIVKLENILPEIENYIDIIDDLDRKISSNEMKERELMLKKQEELLQQKLILESKQTNANTTKFALFMILILLLMITIYLTQRFRSFRFVHERNTMDLELKVLRSQMNPHFIFNTLTSIQNQMLSNDTMASAHSISRFSKLIRQNFEFTSKNEITLSEDIDALENYLVTQQMRYDQKFSYKITIDKDLASSKLVIPPMLLQPFVENAIEHGFKNIDYKGEIKVSVTKLNPYIMQFSIIDNGVGYMPKTDNALHAIDIIKKRLRLNETGDEESFQIKSLGTNKGTQVIFNLYIKRNENFNN